MCRRKGRTRAQHTSPRAVDSWMRTSRRACTRRSYQGGQYGRQDQKAIKTTMRPAGFLSPQSRSGYVGVRTHGNFWQARIYISDVHLMRAFNINALKGKSGGPSGAPAGATLRLRSWPSLHRSGIVVARLAVDGLVWLGLAIRCFAGHVGVFVFVGGRRRRFNIVDVHGVAPGLGNPSR